MSFEMVIFPVSMLQNTSQASAWSSKIGFVTPAMYPGLQRADMRSTAAAPRSGSGLHSLEVFIDRQVGIRERPPREAFQNGTAAASKGTRGQNELRYHTGRLTMSQKEDALLTD